MKLTILFLLFSFTLSAQRLAEVRAVHDGDSFRVKYEDGKSKWIRLFGTDSPEVISNYITRDQPFGRAAGDSVRALIKGKLVAVDSVRTDLYGRTVAKVTLNDGTDLSSYVVANGWAWWWNNARIASDNLDYLKKLQTDAQNAKLGLWGLPGRKIRPSTWRILNQR